MKEEIIRFLSDKLSIPEVELKSDTIFNGLGVSSLKLLNILIDIEDYFGIHFTDREIRSFVTIGDIVCAIENKKSNGKSK